MRGGEERGGEGEERRGEEWVRGGEGEGEMMEERGGTSRNEGTMIYSIMMRWNSIETVIYLFNSTHHKDARSATVSTHKDLSLLNSCAKPVAHCRQSVEVGPVHPSQVDAQDKQKRLPG